MKFSTITAFIDVVLNLVMLLVAVIILIIHIIAIPKPDADIKVFDDFILSTTWNQDLAIDVDLWLQGPDGKYPISYRNKKMPWGYLERDDLGHVFESYTMNGKTHTFKVNSETIHLHELADGIYTFNIHIYGGRDAEAENKDIMVEFIRLNPGFKKMYSRKIENYLDRYEEMTVFQFEIRNGKILELNTDIQVRLAHQYLYSEGQP